MSETNSNEHRYLRLEPNQPTEIRLKYPAGKEVKGNFGLQLRWTLMDGKALYTPLVIGEKAKSLGVRYGEKLIIEKHVSNGKTEWLLCRPSNVAEMLDRAEDLHDPHTGTTGSGPARLSSGASVPGVPTTQLEAALKTAVKAASEAEKEAERLGYSCRFSPSDVRAMGISVFIGMSGGRYAA